MFFRISEALFGVREDTPSGSPPVGGGGKPLRLTPRVFDAMFGGKE